MPRGHGNGTPFCSHHSFRRPSSRAWRTLPVSVSRLADTPEKLAYVQRLTQRRILVYKWQGRLYYAWPDARFCQCIYVGNETQFQEYEKLGFEQKLGHERRTAAEENEAAALFGPWGPW